MAKSSTMDRSSVDKTKYMLQDKYDTAKDKAGTVYYQLQDNARAGLEKAQGLLAVAASILGVVLQDKTRQARKEIKKAGKRTTPMQRSMQENISAGLEKAQDKMQVGMSTAQKLLMKNAYKAQHNLNKAQQNLRDMQASWQSSVVPTVASGLEKTKDVFSKGSEKASQKLQQATSTARNMKESVQDQYSQYQRKRQRARTLFRWGLLAGMIGAILYTPIAGSEMRQRLAAQWQQCRSYLGL